MFERREFAAIRGIAHNLKGTGASYGFAELSRIGAVMQDAADSADLAALHRSIEEFRKIVANAQAQC